MGGTDHRPVRRSPFPRRTLLFSRRPFWIPCGPGGRSRLKTGEAHVWRVPLDRVFELAPTAGEFARAARFRFERHKEEYLRSHAALRAILRRLTDSRLDFAIAAGGKPYLPAAPHLKFNLSHSQDMALVAAA